MIRTTLGLCAAATAAVLGAYTLAHRGKPLPPRAWGYEISGRGWGEASAGRFRSLSQCVAGIRDKIAEHPDIASANCDRYSGYRREDGRWDSGGGVVVERVVVTPEGD